MSTDPLTLLYALVVFVVFVLIAGAVFWLLTKAVDAVPSLGEYKAVLKGAIYVVGILFLIFLLLALASGRMSFGAFGPFGVR